MKVAVGPPVCAEGKCKCERGCVSEWESVRLYVSLTDEWFMLFSSQLFGCIWLREVRSWPNGGATWQLQMFSFCICTAHQKQQAMPPWAPAIWGRACLQLPASFPVHCGRVIGDRHFVWRQAIALSTRISNSALILLDISGSRLIGIHRYAYPCTISAHSGRIFHGLPLLSSLWYIFYPSRLKIQLFHFLWYVAWLFLTQY